jgi:hypothetical protein
MGLSYLIGYNLSLSVLYILTYVKTRCEFTTKLQGPMSQPEL